MNKKFDIFEWNLIVIRLQQNNTYLKNIDGTIWRTVVKLTLKRAWYNNAGFRATNLGTTTKVAWHEIPNINSTKVGSKVKGVPQ